MPICFWRSKNYRICSLWCLRSVWSPAREKRIPQAYWVNRN